MPDPTPETSTPGETERRLHAALRALKLARTENAALNAARLDSMSDEQTRLLATVEEQMRGPLNLMVNSLNLLAHSSLGPDQIEWLQSASQGCRSLTYQVNQLADWHALKSGQLVVDETTVAMSRVVDEVVDLFITQARSDRTELIVSIDPEAAVQMTLDLGRIRQMLINLVAWLFADAGKRAVIVKLKAAGSTMRVTGATDRPRVSPMDLIRPAGPRNSSGSSAADATGIGIIIASDIAAQMDGKLELKVDKESNRHFELQLPMADRSPTGDPRAARLKKASSSTRIAVIGSSSPGDRLGRRLTDVLGRWQVSCRTYSRIKDAMAAGETLFVATAAETTSLRQSARAGLRSIGFIEQSASAPANEGDDLAIFRLPAGDMELLERIFGIGQGSQSIGDHFATSNPANVLLVEDSQANLMITDRILERIGHRVHAVASGRDAVTAARQMSFDLILMDIKMPGMDGIEAARIIASDPSAQSSGVPIIALTAHSREYAAEATEAAGMRAFLDKPISVRDLADAVAQWADQGKKANVERRLDQHLKFALFDKSAIRKMAKEVHSSLIPELGAQFLIDVETRLEKALQQMDDGKTGLIGPTLKPLRGTAASFGARRLDALIGELLDLGSEAQSSSLETLLSLTVETARETSGLLRQHFSAINRGD